MSDLKTAALEYHAQPRPGRLSVELTKPTATAQDLSLAYSPGVAEPVCEIARDTELAYQYTGKGNPVAVISNGTAILGLGNLDPLAFKPVTEGKGVLSKRFVSIDVFDIGVDAKSPQAFIDTVKRISITFGGANLKNIKVPECFEIERVLIEQCDIPVFHGGRHSTAIVTAAGMFNALELVEKKLEKVKIVCLGAGAAAISCMKLLVSMGAKIENIYMIDRKGVIHAGRDDLDQYKLVFATETGKRTLADALKGADVFVGLSGANLLEPEDLERMAPNPIVFACSNPGPEIKPELAYTTHNDVTMTTGRFDYLNRVNSVLGFPFIFRDALDAHATHINEKMKIAAALALHSLVKQSVPEDVRVAYGVDKPEFGREYIIPKPMDKRLITVVFDAVAKAAIEIGVATLPYPENCPLKSVDEVFNG